MVKNPYQPLVKIDGVVRFKENKIVKYLKDTSRFTLDDLIVMPFDNDDWIQFIQLIGYSVGGFTDLSFVDNEVYNEVLELKVNE